MSDFEPASWQHPSHPERAAWLQGSSWDARATWKRESPSEEAVLANCAAPTTAIFHVLLHEPSAHTLVFKCCETVPWLYRTSLLPPYG